MIRLRSVVAVICLSLAAIGLAGCGTYALQGRVIHGTAPQLLVVDRDDPRLEGQGVAGANVRLTLDPQSLGRTILPATTTRSDGTFSIPVEEFGAGTLEYDARLLVRKEGHEFAHEEFPLPRASKRVLIVLPRGVDRYDEPGDPLDDLRRFGD